MCARSRWPRASSSPTCGGLFLFLPHLARLPVETLAQAARLPGSKMIPPAHALRACLALKLWSLERKSHVMSLVADEGLALFSGLNVTPKRSFLSEYSCRVTPRQTQKLLAAWHDQAWGAKLWDGSSFNLDFHSVPYYGDHPLVESHYVSMRSRSQPCPIEGISIPVPCAGGCNASNGTVGRRLLDVGHPASLEQVLLAHHRL